MIVEMEYDFNVLKFDVGKYVAVYINDDQVILIEAGKLINRNNFNILVNDKKIFIEKIKLVQ